MNGKKASVNGRAGRGKRAHVHVMIRNVPRALRDHFKAWCAMREVTMSEKIISLLRECIKERRTP